MKDAIVYSKPAGNTQTLAEAVREALPQSVYFGLPDDRALEADRILVGFWTDKGTCDSVAAEFLQKIRNKEVFLFGSAGFGGKEEYYQQILEKVRENLHPSVKVAGTFMCQGRMPESVRTRYEQMEASPRRDLLIENFDRARSHPAPEDLQALQKAVTR